MFSVVSFGMMFYNIFLHKCCRLVCWSLVAHFPSRGHQTVPALTAGDPSQPEHPMWEGSPPADQTRCSLQDGRQWCVLKRGRRCWWASRLHWSQLKPTWNAPHPMGHTILLFGVWMGWIWGTSPTATAPQWAFWERMLGAGPVGSTSLSWVATVAPMHLPVLNPGMLSFQVYLTESVFPSFGTIYANAIIGNMPQIITDIFDFGSFFISCGLPLQCKFVRLHRQFHCFRSFVFKNNLTYDKYAM